MHFAEDAYPSEPPAAAPMDWLLAALSLRVLVLRPLSRATANSAPRGSTRPCTARGGHRRRELSACLPACLPGSLRATSPPAAPISGWQGSAGAQTRGCPVAAVSTACLPAPHLHHLFSTTFEPIPVRNRILRPSLQTTDAPTHCRPGGLPSVGQFECHALSLPPPCCFHAVVDHRPRPPERRAECNGTRPLVGRYRFVPLELNVISNRKARK